MICINFLHCSSSRHFRHRYGDEESPLDLELVMAEIPPHLRAEVAMTLYGDVSHMRGQYSDVSMKLYVSFSWFDSC